MSKFNINPSKHTKSVLIILLIFILITIAYFPACFEGKALDASDYNVFSGASKELKDFKKNTGEEALWTNSMFCGMPAYLILTNYKGNIFKPYFSFISLIPKPINYVIINFCMFFLLALILGISPWIGFAGALAYGFASYFFILLGEGHVTKVQSLSYLPLLIGGIYLTYSKRLLTGTLLTTIGLSLMLSVNHPQITYYAGILVLIIAITYLIGAIKEKKVSDFLKASGLLVGAAIISVGINFGPLLTTYEYGQYSTRGKLEVPAKDNSQTSGLKREYILDYSYDLGEALTAFIPRFRGGGNSEPLNEDSKTYKLLEEDQGRQEAQKLAKDTPSYWGSQPITRGPFYYGAVFCFLFVLGLFIVKGKEKWWIISAVVIAFLLSLGKNIPFLASFMIDHFPGYNKFRDVKGIIVIQQFAMAVLGLLTIKEIYSRNINSKKFLNSLKFSFFITGGIASLFIIIPRLAGDFRGSYDEILIHNMGWPQEFIDALVSDRRSMVRIDSFRTLLFISIAAAGLWAFWTKKIKAQYALAFWVILTIADLWTVDKRYLNNDCFVSKKRAENTFLPTAADKYILRDKDPNYRVLNLSLDPYTDTSTSYFHKSLGGNHGAKMQRFNDMVYFNISREFQVILGYLENRADLGNMDSLLSISNSLNMLNTRYIILDPNLAPVTNRYAMGNAWFVGNCKWVNTPEEEVRAIKDIKPESTAVFDRKFEKELSGKSFGKDNQSTIKLKSYAPNKLVYQSKCASEQLAVFSEIYYPKGWIAKIDGSETPYLRANYILRSMVVPAGIHEIVFEFKPKSYEIGNKISFASSILLIFAIAGVIFVEYKKRSKSSTNG
jgi:hypothetical protein